MRKIYILLFVLFPIIGISQNKDSSDKKISKIILKEGIIFECLIQYSDKDSVTYYDLMGQNINTISRNGISKIILTENSPEKLSIKTVQIVSNPIALKDKLEYRLDYTNYCLNQYQKEKMIGVYLQIAGGAILFGVSSEALLKKPILYHSSDMEQGFILRNKYDNDIIKYNDRKGVANIIGCVIGLAGTTLTIVNSRWLKRAYVGPDGLGIRFKF